MSWKEEVAKAEDLESPFLLYRFSTENHASEGIQGQCTDFIDVLAVADHVGIPCLPIIWQTARASIGLGGTSCIRRAPLDAQTELAFKLVKDEEKVFGRESDLFSLIWSEIRILGHPKIGAHKNIVDLLGVCWDIAEGDNIWPALVFEKSHFGDLHHFANLPIWMELSSKDKLKICIDIGNALSLMHLHSEWPNPSERVFPMKARLNIRTDIIHGDLKPHNILIFKDNDTIVAKITDFGYGRQFSSPTDGHSLPLSRPWEAPQVDGSNKKFSWTQAEQADIYSYALLCAWILYEHHFPEGIRRDDTFSYFGTANKGEMRSIIAFQHLKSTGKLMKLVRDIVDSDNGLEPRHRIVLGEFFHNVFTVELSAKNKTLLDLLELLERPDPDFPQLYNEAGTHEIEFQLGTGIAQYYQCDHRVRSHIAKCLQNRVDGAGRGSSKTNDTIQLAICYHIGFGVPRNEDKFEQLCADGEQKRRIQAAIKALNSSPKKFNHPLVRCLPSEGRLGNLHQNGQNQNLDLLQETEKVLSRELGDLGNSIDDFALQLIVMRALNECLRVQGHLDLVENLESQMLDVDMKIFGTEDMRTVASMTNLAHLHLSRGKLDLALGLTNEALQASLRIRGPDEVTTLIIMGKIAAIYSSLGEFDQAEKLELLLQENRTALLGKHHPDTLTSINNQAMILRHQGRLQEAVSLAGQAYESRQKMFRIDHPDTVISKRILGEDSPGTLMNMSNLALNHWHRDKLQDAEDLGLQVVAKRRSVLGPNHPDTLTSIANLALVYESQGRLEEALDLEINILDKSRECLGKSHPDTLMSMDNLANTYQNMNKWAEAESLLLEALATRKAVLGEVHPDTMENTHKLLLVLYQLGNEKKIREIAEGLAALES